MTPQCDVDNAYEADMPYAETPPESDGAIDCLPPTWAELADLFPEMEIVPR